MRKPSLRLQWLLALGVAALALVAIVHYVDTQNATANMPDPAQSRQQQVAENEAAETVVREDQAPHTVALRTGQGARAAASDAVTAYMRHQIAIAAIDGPIEHSGCAGRNGGSATRIVLGCEVEAADVEYPFDVVILPGARRLTYCKVDAPPVPSMRIPVSSRCT
jgi:hypothetical protein